MSDLYSSVFSITKAFTQAGQMLVDNLDRQGLTLSSVSTGQKDRKTEEQRQRHLDLYEQRMAWLHAPASERDITATNRELDLARQAARDELREITDWLENARANAPKFNGEAAFRTQDHQKAFTESGHQLTQQQMDSIPWDSIPKGKERYYEEVIARSSRHDQVLETITHLDEIDDLAEGATNAENEDRKARIKEILRANPDVQRRLDAVLQAEATPSASAVASPSGMDAKPLAAAFQPAHDGVAPAPAAAPDITTPGTDFDALTPRH